MGNLGAEVSIVLESTVNKRFKGAYLIHRADFLHPFVLGNKLINKEDPLTNL
jgi:hypothetical protein